MSNYHQFSSSQQHRFLAAEPQFPLRQLDIRKGRWPQRTKTCWFDSFCFFLSRPIHGHFFHQFIRSTFKLNNLLCEPLASDCEAYYTNLVEYLCNSTIVLPPITEKQTLHIKEFAVCQLLGGEDFGNRWKKGHALYEPFRNAMYLNDWSEQTVWFSSKFKGEAFQETDSWGWPQICTPHNGTTDLDVDYLNQIECVTSVPTTEYIAINILREYDTNGLTLQDGVLTPVDLVFGTIVYELISLFPWNEQHVTCLHKSTDGSWEAFDNEEEDYFVDTLAAITHSKADFNIQTRNIFAIYRKTTQLSHAPIARECRHCLGNKTVQKRKGNKRYNVTCKNCSV